MLLTQILKNQSDEKSTDITNFQRGFEPISAPHSPFMLMVNEHDASFPAASVAVQVTVVTPIGNSSPDWSPPASQTMVGSSPELSWAVTSQVTTAPGLPGSVTS